MAKFTPKEPSDKLKKVLKKRYDTTHDPVVEEEPKEKVKQGKPWTKVGTYNSYEAAAKSRDSIVKKSPEYATKIKRSGPKQTKVKVLKRKSKELAKKAKEQ